MVRAKCKKPKVRLYSQREPRLPLPRSLKKQKVSFALRTINTADKRFAVVKELHARLEQLKEDAGVTTLQREWLAARACFLVARIESLEYDSVTGTAINWQQYMSTVKCLADVLKRLGLHDERRSAKQLSDYIVESQGRTNGKHHK